MNSNGYSPNVGDAVAYRDWRHATHYGVLTKVEIDFSTGAPRYFVKWPSGIGEWIRKGDFIPTAPTPFAENKR